ncbi:hypothetical protein AA313_de0200423 [Arthrobotrys entomopaga]|nr:hypothetical protein AA313_de0200423 [Arthrobotrys entomopaga]
MGLPEAIGCQRMKKRYQCGGEFDAEITHFCSSHPPDPRIDCKNMSTAGIRYVPKSCKRCRELAKSRRRANELRSALNNLENAVPRNETAIEQKRIDLHDELMNGSWWESLNHSE